MVAPGTDWRPSDDGRCVADCATRCNPDAPVAAGHGIGDALLAYLTIWGIAAYSFHFVFSQNIGGAIEGSYSETGQWEWIFWQNTVLTPVMMLLAAVAMPRRVTDRQLLRGKIAHAAHP